MPKANRGPGRPAGRFQFPATWEEIAARVRREPKPPECWTTLNEPAELATAKKRNGR